MNVDPVARAALQVRGQAIVEAKLAHDHIVQQASIEYRRAIDEAYAVWQAAMSNEVVTAE